MEERDRADASSGEGAFLENVPEDALPEDDRSTLDLSDDLVSSAGEGADSPEGPQGDDLRVPEEVEAEESRGVDEPDPEGDFGDTDEALFGIGGELEYEIDGESGDPGDESVQRESGRGDAFGEEPGSRSGGGRSDSLPDGASFGRPPTSREVAAPQLCLTGPQQEPDASDPAVVLDGDQTVVGRESPVEALRQDEFMSPRHALFVRRDDGVYVRDVSNFNGVFREVRRRMPIEDGRWIRLGQQTLEFQTIAHPKERRDDGTRFATSPNPGFWGRILVLVGPETGAAAYPLVEESVVLGRDGGDVKFPNDRFMSGRHAEIEYADGNVVIDDLDSVNGTYLSVDGETRLRDGDHLLIGRNLFRFEW